MDKQNSARVSLFSGRGGMDAGFKGGFTFLKRGISMREAARMQSFPDAFLFAARPQGMKSEYNTL
ncbi:MAG: DNA cytosine methyltransferase [Treponema sp.]|jgi:site-specific DNA-cytosine methylase|nr:DNA cytosine methyltransferase [Treponema sp.]